MAAAARNHPRPVLVWFRDDLRLDDHPALAQAAGSGRPVVPCYVLEPPSGGAGVDGSAAAWWLHHALAGLDADLRERGSRLVLRRGPAPQVLPALAAETGAAEVCFLRRWSPGGCRLDDEVRAALSAGGVAVREFAADMLAEPPDVATGKGTPFRVFTPFWRHLQRRGDPPAPVPAPPALAAPFSWPAGTELSDLGLLPRVDWTAGLEEAWRPGAAGAAAAWSAFRAGALADYAEGRDLPGAPGTSRLSPHLRFGEISVRRIRHDLAAAGLVTAAEPWLRQLAWRDFARHLLHHFPATLTEPLDPRFRDFPWEVDADHLAAWRRGRTGYPLVDAGMRQLWRTGWMHNRVRMVAASFLVKHLLLPWQEGAAWFADTLVDHDPANNVLGWQWTAGCGADAAPFFRIFNPVAQGRRFDADGTYVAHWIPELAGLSARRRHAPWEAPAGELAAAGVILGETYPRPVIDHAEARARALAAWELVKRAPRES